MLSVSHRPGHTISLVKSQDRIYHLRRALMLPLLTGIQQQFHHGEVWMWNTVVERHVPVAVCQIDDVWQQSGRGQTHLAQVRSDGVGLGVLLTGHPEPLLIEGYQDQTLARRDEDVTVKAELVAVLLLFLNVFFKGIDGVKRLAFAGWTIALFTLYYCPHWSLKTKRNENNKRRKRGCKKIKSIWVLQRRAHQPVINHLKQWKSASYHFFIWRGHLFHAIFHVDASIYKPFVDLLSGRREKFKQ